MTRPDERLGASRAASGVALACSCGKVLDVATPVVPAAQLRALWARHHSGPGHAPVTFEEAKAAARALRAAERDELGLNHKARANARRGRRGQHGVG